MDEPGPRPDELANTVIGAAIEVHRELGPGYLESVYEQALVIELGLRAIPFARQPLVGSKYKGQSIGQDRLDLLVSDQLVVELNAVEQLAPIHTAQVIPYLKATNLRLGLLINFNVPHLRQGLKRVVNFQ